MGTNMEVPFVDIHSHRASGFALKNHTQQTGKAGQGQPTDDRQADDGTKADNKRLGVGCHPPEPAHVYKKFANKTVKGWKTRNGQGADEKCGPGDLHVFKQTAQGIDGFRPRFMDHDAGAHEQQGLEDGMVQHVQHSPAKTEDRHDWIAQRHADHTNPQADQYDANVFNARVG